MPGFFDYLWGANPSPAPAPSAPQPETFDLWPKVDPSIRALVQQAASDQDLPYDLLMRQIQQESSFNPNAVNKRTGATGLLQLMPATARELGVEDPRDPAQNIAGGAAYMRQLLDRFKNYDLALAAYHAGRGTVARAQGMPKSRTTRAYVQRILQGR